MVIKIVNDPCEWNRFIDLSPYSLLFHKWEFLKIMESYSGYNLLSYGIYRGNELICLFPIFLKNYLSLRLIFSPPPMMGVPYLGFVMSKTYASLKQRRKEAYLSIVAEDITREIKNLRPSYVSIITTPSCVDSRPFIWNGYDVEINYTYKLGLEKTIDEIWQDFDVGCRKNIKNASKEGLLIRQVHDPDEFYLIMKNRYGEQGLKLPILNKEYFRQLMTTFPLNIKLFYIYNGDKVVDVVVICEYNGKFMFWMGWVNLNKSINCTEFLIWEFIKNKKKEGLRELEMEGANVRRLCEFKSKFNPSLENYFVISEKNIIGNIVEWSYLNFWKKNSGRL